MNSVSATALSKMVFCEVNVIKKAKLTRQDRRRIEKGNREHALFERAIRQASYENRASDEKTLKSTQAHQSRAKLCSIRTMAAILLICAIGIYFVIGIQS